MMMDKAKMTLMKMLLEAMVSGKAFNMIEELVTLYMNVNVSGAEKKARVKEKVMPYVRTFGKFVLSTAITFAVDSIRMQMVLQDGNGTQVPTPNDGTQVPAPGERRLR